MLLLVESAAKSEAVLASVVRKENDFLDIFFTETQNPCNNFTRTVYHLNNQKCYHVITIMFRFVIYQFCGIGERHCYSIVTKQTKIGLFSAKLILDLIFNLSLVLTAILN